MTIQDDVFVKSLSRSHLLNLIEYQNKITAQLCQDLIDAGRGHETLQTIRTKKDELSIKYSEACIFDSMLSYEKERRMQYHGKLTPIKGDK